ncbi:MAG: DUF2911 domain-containing protein [Bacteroidetes bacterium]|nr:DUF2911 domain-containing protein [Bacteroidota bacterium]MDA1333828.1 DUF2911 domain-containing protein [Bacteroidota bacterium]
MYRLLSRVLALLCFVFLGMVPIDASAQAASERSVLKQTIANAEIEIDYARPSVRGRDPLFGGVEDWDINWTPGANMSTAFRFSEDVKINNVDVEAGRYSVWFHLVEDGPWSLVLDRDTTLFHVPYPALDSAYTRIEFQPKEIDFFTETLTFDIQHIRVDGGQIHFKWGTTFASFDLGVDPGYDYVFTLEEVEPYLGNWMIDESVGRPSDEEIEEYKEGQTEEQIKEMMQYFDDMMEPSDLRVEFDSEKGHLIGYSDRWSEMMGQEPGTPQMIFIRKAQGIFSTGGYINGDLASLGDWDMWEFEFDEDGHANRFVQRAQRDDRVMAEGVRVED